MAPHPKARVEPLLVVTLVLAAALVAGLVVAGRKASSQSQSPSAAADRDAEVVTFRGKTHPFVLRLPSTDGWKPPNHAPARADVADLLLQRSQDGAVVMVLAIETSRTLPLTRWKKLVAANSGDQAAFEGEDVHTVVDGEPALVTQARRSKNGVEMAFRILTVARDDILYAVLVGAPGWAAQPDADTVFRGFTLPPKGSRDDRPSPPFDVPGDGPEPKAPDTALDFAVRAVKAGSVDGAIHWLQRASDDDGVGEVDVNGEPSLAPVRSDARWPVLAAFLRANHRYWARHPALSEHVELPPRHAPNRPVRVVVVMPGAVTDADPFLRDWMKDEARLTNSAFIGVTGPRGVGRRACAWSESVDEDTARVEGALARLAGRVTIKEGNIVLAGWADGGRAATAIAARHPHRFAGALSLVPATLVAERGSLVSESGVDLTGRRFMLVAGRGADEIGSLPLVEADARALQARGATVEQKTYADAAKQLFGQDLPHFHRWVEFVSSGKKP